MNPAATPNGFFFLLNADPPVIYMKDWVFDRPQAVHWLQLQTLYGRRAHLLVQISWTHEASNVLDGRIKRVGRYIRRNPKHKVTLLANSRAEYDALVSRGVDVLFCNGAAFLSEAVFHPVPGCRKEFRAVYDAAIAPYKRLELAQDIRDLAMITHTKHNSSPAYTQRILKTLKQANWLNGVPDQPTRWFGPHDVNQAINRARVGLCLSAVEGFMYASAQYLLAGLPVVTTASVGGRDVMYDTGYVRVVADDPAAIEKAVEEWCAAPPPAELIRHNTLKRFEPFRNRLVDYMRETLAGHDGADVWKRVWDGGWPEGLPHKLHGSGFSFQSNILALTKPGEAAPWLAHGSLPAETAV